MTESHRQFGIFNEKENEISIGKKIIIKKPVYNLWGNDERQAAELSFLFSYLADHWGMVP